MSKKIKKRAIPATNAKRSNVIVKSISRADVVALNRNMAPIIEQNRKEYNAGLEAILKDRAYYCTN